MMRLQHDLNLVSSVGLIATGLSTGITGIVADLWDLNDFWYHTVSGYVMGAFAILHLAINWNRMVGYARFRLASFRGRKAEPKQPRPAVPSLRPPQRRSPSDLVTRLPVRPSPDAASSVSRSAAWAA
jgi:hypothetical protein